jgi:hypothetical protein
MERFRSFLLFSFVVAGVFELTCYGDSHVLIEDDLSSAGGGWKEVYLEGTRGGSYSVSGGKLKINLDEEGRYGVYNTEPVSGHFLVEADFEEDENVGLALIQEKDRKPDVENYTMITVDKEDGVVVVAVKDCQGGKKDVLDNTGEFRKERSRRRPHQANDDYRHALNAEMYSVRFTETTKRVRIFRDSGPGFFHFYYGVGQKIHGEEASGWMELTPSKDWGREGHKYYVAMVALGKGEAVFKNIIAVQKPTVDQDDRQTGFNIDHREYNWSGFFGHALVVTFGDEFPYRDKDYKFVTWSEMNYIPAWHMNNQLLYTYEFVETWGGGNPGCHEPMSDRIKRWASVQIVEDNAVRKVFKWYYVLCNPDYKVPDDDKGEQLPEVEEYYTFYPDGSGTRNIMYIPKLDTDFRAPHELGELISCAGSQTHSKPFYDSPALTLMNLEGDVEQAHPGIKIDYGSHVDDWKQMIMAVHLKNMPDVFAVWSTDPAVPDTYSGYPIRYEIAWQSVNGTGSHWPVNKRPFTGDSGSGGTLEAEVSHSCLLSWGVRDGTDWQGHYKTREDGRKYREWVALIGLNEKGDLDGARDKAKSWLFPGQVKMLDENCRFVKNDVARKALVFEKTQEDMKCHFEIEPKDSVMINPAIVVNDWGAWPFVKVQMGEMELSKGKYKLALEGKDLLIWIPTEIRDKTKFMIDGLGEPYDDD